MYKDRDKGYILFPHTVEKMPAVQRTSPKAGESQALS